MFTMTDLGFWDDNIFSITIFKGLLHPNLWKPTISYPPSDSIIVSLSHVLTRSSVISVNPIA